MPWTAADAQRHTQAANTPKRQRRWAEVANDALKRCLADGKAQKHCEGSAIRQANAVVGRMGEVDMTLGDVGQIAKSAIETGLAVVRRTGELTEARAESLLHSLEAELHGVWTEGAGLAATAPATVDVDGKRVTISELVDVFAEAKGRDEAKEAHLARAKKYGIAALDPPDGNRTKPSEYAGIADADFGDPVNYKYPCDAAHAKAALGYFNHADARESGGYSEADWAKVGRRLAPLISKHLKADYEYAAGKIVRKEEEVGEAADGSLDNKIDSIRSSFHAAFRVTRGDGPSGPWARAVYEGHAELGDCVVCRDEGGDGQLYAVPYQQKNGTYTFGPRAEWTAVVPTYKKAAAAAAECALAESVPLEMVGEFREAGEPLLAALAETLTPGTGPRAPVVVDLALIRPGPGNKRDRHYYGADVLRRDAHVFAGVHVFATDHNERERSERTKVGRIREIVGFTDVGAPIARTVIYDPDQAEKTRNRAAADELATMECSILASGRARPGRVDGEDYKVVEAITGAAAVDLVSKAGAGGHATAIAESAAGGDDMGGEDGKTENDEKRQQQATGDGAAGDGQAAAPPAPAPLGADAVKRAVSEAKVPEPWSKWIERGAYLDEAALKAAIAEAQADARKATGAPTVVGMGGTAPAREKGDLEAKLAEVDRKHGVRPLVGGDNLKEASNA